MTNEERDIQRKLKVLQHAEKIGNAAKLAGILTSADQAFIVGVTHTKSIVNAGLKNAKSIPKKPANQRPAEIIGQVLHLRRKYHLRPIGIV